MAYDSHGDITWHRKPSCSFFEQVRKWAAVTDHSVPFFPVWNAPYAHGPIDACIEIPGSKSLTVRALLLAALADRPSIIHGVLDSRDTSLFAEGLRVLGAQITPYASDSLRVTPLPPFPHAQQRSPHTLNIMCGLAGTVMRFLPPIAALTGRPVHFDGDEAARRRPLGPLLDSLESLGAHIEYEGKRGFLPFTICGPLRAPSSGIVEVDASSSSQFFSALLMLAPLLEAPVQIHSVGPVVSLPHIHMTVEALHQRGIAIDCRTNDLGAAVCRVQPCRPRGQDTHIEPDLSNAGPFLALAHITGGRVVIPHWPSFTTQAGDAWRSILPRLGARVSFTDEGLALQGPGAGEYDGFEGDFSDVGELIPTLVAIMLFARTRSVLRGIAHLRGHETNRLAALVEQICALGGKAQETDDGLVIYPTSLHPTQMATYEDHRMATFAAIVGAVVRGVSVENIATTSKTLPDFPQLWTRAVMTASPQSQDFSAVDKITLTGTFSSSKEQL
nr:3-phosphoshikimate 1-carboxyvinyltransferase [Schaalia sp. lx-100]